VTEWERGVTGSDYGSPDDKSGDAESKREEQRPQREGGGWVSEIFLRGPREAIRD